MSVLNADEKILEIIGEKARLIEQCDSLKSQLAIRDRAIGEARNFVEECYNKIGVQCDEACVKSLEERARAWLSRHSTTGDK